MLRMLTIGVVSGIGKDNEMPDPSTRAEKWNSANWRFIHTLFLFLLLCLFYNQPLVTMFIKMPFSFLCFRVAFLSHGYVHGRLTFLGEPVLFLDECSGTQGTGGVQRLLVGMLILGSQSWFGFSSAFMIHMCCVFRSSIKCYLISRVDWSRSGLQPKYLGELEPGWQLAVTVSSRCRRLWRATGWQQHLKSLCERTVLGPPGS